jgi:hypothetical protein
VTYICVSTSVSSSRISIFGRKLIPNLELIELGLTDVLWQRMAEQTLASSVEPFRASVGLTAFEELGCEWMLVQAHADKLSSLPEIVGSHWAPDAQVDVVAVNWREKAILGECKWSLEAVGRSVVRRVVNKAPRVVPGDERQVHYIFFAHAGFTDAARAEAETAGVQLVNLETWDADLRHILAKA